MNPETPGPIPGLRQLREDVQPQQDLWPGIQLRLRPRRNAAPWISLALAASLVMALAAHVRLQVPQAEPELLAAAPAALDPLPLRRHERALVRANLKIVNDAERRLGQALRQNPDSEPLRHLLESTQQQRRDLRRLLAQST